MALRAGSGASVRLARAMPRFMASETSRCWAPSCRSRSIRRRSASVALTMSARLRARVSTRSASSSLRLGPSRVRAADSSARLTPRASHGAANSAATARMIRAQGKLTPGSPVRSSPSTTTGSSQDAATRAPPRSPVNRLTRVVAELAPGCRGPQRAQRPPAEAGRAQRRRELQAERGVQPGALQRGLPEHQPGQHERDDKEGRHVQRDVPGVVRLGGGGEDRRAPGHARHAEDHRGNHGDQQAGQRVAGGPPRSRGPQRGKRSRGRVRGQQAGPEGTHDVTV